MRCWELGRDWVVVVGVIWDVSGLCEVGLWLSARGRMVVVTGVVVLVAFRVG